MSTGPNAPVSDPNARSTSWGSLMSATACAKRLAPASSSAARPSRLAFLSMAAIFAPSSRNNRHRLWPIPPAAPVMATTLSLNVMRCSRKAPCPPARLQGSPLERPFHETLEEQPLRQRERDDAGRHDDDVDRREVWPCPLPLSALGGGENHRHRAFGLVIDKRQAQQIFAPCCDKIDDEDYDQSIAHHWQADLPQRPPVPGAVDSRGFEHFVRDKLEHAAHDQNADRELQRHVGQNEAGRVVDQAEPMLRLVNADDRDDAHGEIERNEQRRHDEPRAERFDMHERVAREHRASRRDEHGAGGHIDAVEQVDRQRRDAVEHKGVMREIEMPRPEIAAHRVGHRFDRHQQYPGEGQEDDEVEQVDDDVAKGGAARGGGARISEFADFGAIGFERLCQLLGRKTQNSPAMTNIMAMAPIMPMEAA